MTKSEIAFARGKYMNDAVNHPPTHHCNAHPSGVDDEKQV